MGHDSPQLRIGEARPFKLLREAPPSVAAVGNHMAIVNSCSAGAGPRSLAPTCGSSSAALFGRDRRRLATEGKSNEPPRGSTLALANASPKLCKGGANYRVADRRLTDAKTKNPDVAMAREAGSGIA